ncbi:unnamed protein product [Rotaria sp. Silwood2]|nr:unnamed protein product [Rotaria sp. Silwood2]CAF2549140.1 unnamed protein product [Rotaria sp. Silwood2]CAF2799714.1 unnamed protein product [Rotaria sp. Silwood2]CAF2957744.1 unnamed protein product [Rotaria sp. Silwood2]CAF4131980.1 unnamed protein product [Rotaria sp. Silwood2]
MCTDIDFLPHIMVITEKEFILSNEYDRRNSSTPSMTSSSSSTTTTTTITTTTTATTNSTSWIERKLFSHFKRLFRRNSFSSKTNSSQSSRRPSCTIEQGIESSFDEHSKQTNEHEQEENKEHGNLPSSSSSSSSPSSSPTPSLSTISNPISEQAQSITNNSNSIDLLYDYDRLLARCLERQKRDLSEMISRCQTPITIPRADLIVGHSRSILVNWKSYTRLFRALNRDPQLFQQYINQYYACQSSTNQREQLIFNARTTRTTFDNVLKVFLNEYVTCLACQKAETHLIKSTGLWRIECQLCGSQRSVKRLKWKL